MRKKLFLLYSIVKLHILVNLKETKYIKLHFPKKNFDTGIHTTDHHWDI